MKSASMWKGDTANPVFFTAFVAIYYREFFIVEVLDDPEEIATHFFIWLQIGWFF